MRFLALTLLALTASAADVGLDVLGFGASWHSNRNYPWTEVNPGLGVAPYYKIAPGLEAFVAAGGFTNSTNKHTFFAAPGLRYQYGYVGAEAGVGYLNIDYDAIKEIRFVGSVFASAGPLSLHATYIPKKESSGDIPDTKGAAVWLRLRIR